jgi:hypothetical protein
VTNLLRFAFDFVIAATGVRSDLSRRPEPSGIADLMGRSLHPAAGEGATRTPKAALSRLAFRVSGKAAPNRAVSGTYLHIQFLGDGQYGSVATSAAGHRYGVPRVARGVTRSLFLAHQDDLLASLRSFAEAEIDANAADVQPAAGAGIARR